MFNNKCIYCKKQKNLTKEHAFPKALLQEDVPGWVIDKHLCKKCNSDLGKLDVILTKKSPLAFIWDQIKNELGNTTQTPHSSIYREKAVGINPVGLFFPDPHYDNHIVLHEAKTVSRGTNELVHSATALRPQIVLTQCSQGQSVEKVIAENCARYYLAGLDAHRITNKDKSGEVHCIFGNTYIFPPKTSEHFFRNIPEFTAKYITDSPRIQYGLRVITPGEGKYQQGAENFYNAFSAAKKEIIQGEKFLNPEPVEHRIEVRADQDAIPFFVRAIAKVAFHCFLFHYREFSGHEPIFNDIKEFIHTGSPNRFVNPFRHADSDNLVFRSSEHRHRIVFYLKEGFIGCQLDFFTGLLVEPYSFQIALAGNAVNSALSPNRVEYIPFYVHPKSQMKRRICRAENLGLIHIPTPYEGVLLLPRYFT